MADDLFPLLVFFNLEWVSNSYAKFITNHPVLIVTATFLVNITALLMVVWSENFPVFENPQAGFAPRGTLINQRSLAWRNFVTQIAPDVRNSSVLWRHQKSISKQATTAEIVSSSSLHSEHAKYLEDLGVRNISTLSPSPYQDDFFCGHPGQNFARIVFGHRRPQEWLDLQTLLDICETDEMIRQLPEAVALTVKPSHSDRLCPSWTLANYITALSKQSSCRSLSVHDVDSARKLLSLCINDYRSGALHDNCSSVADRCHPVPIACVENKLVYHLFRFIADNASLETDFNRLEFSAAYLPVSRGSSEDHRKLQNIIRDVNLTGGYANMVRVEMVLAEKDTYGSLIHDLRFMAAGLSVVTVILWIYTGSLLVALLNMLAVFFSLLLSYIFYKFVLRLAFFPVTNLLACFLMTAIGSDALIVYSKVWNLAKTQNDGKFEKIVQATIRQGSRTVAISSMSTAAVLFASLITPFVAVRCFSIFVGTTVLIHHIFVVSWLPASVIIADKWGLSSCHSPSLCQKLCDLCSPTCHFFYRLYYFNSGLRLLCDCSRIFFEKILPCVVIRFKWIWTLTFLLVFTASCIVIFYHPKMEVSPKLVHSDDHEYGAGTVMPLRFVWGLFPTAAAQFLDPHYSKELIFDVEFDSTAAETKNWMSGFCRRLQLEAFYLPPMIDCTTCLAQPYDFCNSEELFALCAQKFPRHINQSLWFGPNSSYAQSSMTPVVIQTSSSRLSSQSQPIVFNVFNEINTWFQAELDQAPPSIKRGWFYSSLDDVLDLQQSLLASVFTLIPVSVGVTFITAVIFTRNVVVSLLAVVVISGITTGVIASMVLMGWQMGFLETTLIGISVGISVNFTLHYAVAYCASANEDREMKANQIIAEMASPVTTAAFAVTLFNLLMTPSQVPLYHQTAVFMAVLTSLSLLYSTIFFPAILAILGPEGDFCQFYCPSKRFLFCCQPDPSKLVEKGMHSSTEFIDAKRTVSGTAPEKPLKSALKFNPVAKPLVSRPVIVNPITQLPPIISTNSDEDETDSIGALGSVPTSRGPSRGTSLIRKQGMFSWDYVMQKVPLSRHFSVAGSSVIYIDADVRSVSSDLNLEIPVVLPNRKEGIPEVWVKRVDC